MDETRKRIYENNKKWLAAHPEWRKKYWKEYYAKNRDKFRARRKELYEANKPKHKAYQKAFRDRLPKELRYARSRKNTLWTNFRRTPEWFVETLAAQGGHCFLCPATPDDQKQKRKFAIDHDHSCCPTNGKSCGKCVRAIVCHTCNLRVGYLEVFLREGLSISAPEGSWLSNALKYLNP